MPWAPTSPAPSPTGSPHPGIPTGRDSRSTLMLLPRSRGPTSRPGRTNQLDPASAGTYCCVPFTNEIFPHLSFSGRTTTPETAPELSPMDSVTSAALPFSTSATFPFPPASPVLSLTPGWVTAEACHHPGIKVANIVISSLPPGPLDANPNVS